MPGQMSNYLENALLQKLLGQSGPSFSSASALRLALCTVFNEADDGSTYTEVPAAGTGYVRQSFAIGSTLANGVANSGLISFPRALTGWGTPRYWVVFDSGVGGNLLWWGQITNPLSINTNEKIEFDPGQITISLSGALTATATNQAFDSILRGASWNLMPITHVGLLTNYTSDQTFQEVNDQAYARQSVAFGGASGGTTSNTARLQWNAAVADYTVNYVGLFNASSGGQLIMAQSLGGSTVISAGKNFRFEANDLSITLD